MLLFDELFDKVCGKDYKKMLLYINKDEKLCAAPCVHNDKGIYIFYNRKLELSNCSCDISFPMSLSYNEFDALEITKQGIKIYIKSEKYDKNRIVNFESDVNGSVFSSTTMITLEELIKITKYSSIDVLNKIKRTIENNTWNKEDILYFIELFIKQFDNNFEDICKELIMNGDQSCY